MGICKKSLAANCESERHSKIILQAAHICTLPKPQLGRTLELSLAQNSPLLAFQFPGRGVYDLHVRQNTSPWFSDRVKR